MAAQALAKSFVGSTRSFQARGNARASRAAVKVAAADRPLWLPGDGGGQASRRWGRRVGSAAATQGAPKHQPGLPGAGCTRVRRGAGWGRRRGSGSCCCLLNGRRLLLLPQASPRPPTSRARWLATTGERSRVQARLASLIMAILIAPQRGVRARACA